MLFIGYLYADVRQGHGKQIPGVSRAAGHILPYQHAHRVTMVIPPGGFHLDMLAQHIEAQRLCLFNVPAQRFIAGRGVQPVRPVSLIQKPFLEVRPAIEQKIRCAVLIRLHSEGAQAEVAFYPVSLTPGAQKAQAHPVEKRLFGRPETGRFKRNRLAAARRKRVGGDA